MLVQTVIDHIKEYHKGVSGGKQIDEQTTRGKALYGNSHQKYTGVITTCWASVNVIREATKRGANLIIVHEALFWSHKGHTDWLRGENNQPFLAKKKLLNKAGIVVWRDHDYIHSGIPMEDGGYADGIFCGVADKPGWTQYITKDIHHPLHLTIPETTVRELTDFLTQKLQLDGIKIIGNKNSTIERTRIPFHILGGARDSIQGADQENINCYLTTEIMDFTLAEYIRDSSMLGMGKAIIGMGHFNLEEPGMGCMITYLPTVVEADIPCAYIQSGDIYGYKTRQYRRRIQKLHK